MRPEDRAYLAERAEEEIKMAQAAKHGAAVRAHYELAGYYLDKVHGGGESGSASGRATGGLGEERAR